MHSTRAVVWARLGQTVCSMTNQDRNLQAHKVPHPRLQNQSCMILRCCLKEPTTRGKEGNGLPAKCDVLETFDSCCFVLLHTPR